MFRKTEEEKAAEEARKQAEEEAQRRAAEAAEQQRRAEEFARSPVGLATAARQQGRQLFQLCSHSPSWTAGAPPSAPPTTS